MAREIITKIWCDICMEEEQYTEGAELPPVTLGNWKPRVLAMCPPHKKEIYEPLETALRELGQILPEQASANMTRMPGQAPGSGTFPCPDPTCAKHKRPYKHEQSLRNHGKEVHGTRGLRELYAKFNATGEGTLFENEPPEAEAPEVLVVADDEPKVKSVTCAEMMLEYTGKNKDACEQTYSWPDNARPRQAMGVHLAKRHGIRGKKHDRKGAKVPA